MNCIIVDDDELSRIAMEHLVEQVNFLKLTAVCSGSIEALNVINEEKIDLILLDIEMPELSGMDLLKSLEKPPLTILATSKVEYAVEAFEYNVIDYLVKPISIERFFKAVTKAKETYDMANLDLDFSNKEFIYIKTNSALTKIITKEILWIEALGDYITIHEAKKKHVIHSTMKAIEGKLPSDKFVRVHRSFIVPIDNINAIQDDVIVMDKKLIPVGAVYKEKLMKHLNLL